MRADDARGEGFEEGFGGAEGEVEECGYFEADENDRDQRKGQVYQKIENQVLCSFAALGDCATC